MVSKRQFRARALRVVLHFIAVVAFTLGQISNALARADSVTVYPGPSGISPSPQYAVQVIQNDRPHDSFVYQTQNPGFTNAQLNGQPTSSTEEQSTAWTSFSAGDPVTVSITNLKPFTAARVLPSHERIPVIVQGSTVRFTITHPGQYAVDFCTSGSTCTESNVDLSNPLLIFANPPEANVPQAGKHGVHYFGPGVHDLGTTPYVIRSDEVVYLAGGAYVKGFFQVADGASNWAIRGRGILSGEDVQKSECNPNCVPMISAPNETLGHVEGVTLIQSPLYNIALGGYNKTFSDGKDNTATRNVIDNVKIIGWHGNTDGVAAAYGSDDHGSILRNSFFKVGDSAIHLNSSNLLVTGCTIWQLRTSAPFEISDTMGGNLNIDVHDVVVRNSDVIRTETAAESMEGAIFSAHQGGKGTLRHYLFDDLRVENASFRLFSLAVRPSPWSKKNGDLAGIDDLLFRNIQVADAQKLPNLLQSYDPHHQLSHLRFESVVVAGTALPEYPTVTFSANRTMSLNGNVTYDPLWRNTQNPTDFLTQIVDPTAAPSLQYKSVTLHQPQLTAEFKEEAIGDFYGDGYASVLFSRDGALGIWKDPAHPLELPLGGGYYPIGYTLKAGDRVVGVGDFNDDGRSDIVIWNFTTQTGTVLLMDGQRILGVQAVRPGTPSDWNTVWVGDFDQNGYSDILLRNSEGDVEILRFGSGDTIPRSADFKSSVLFANSTSYYDQHWPHVSGTFDSSWVIAGVGDSRGLGYANIVWYKPTTGDLGMTVFSPDFQNEHTGRIELGQIFLRRQLPPTGQAIVAGDFDADGAVDVLLQNPVMGSSPIVYTSLWLTNEFTQGTGGISVSPDWMLLR
ncbi:hypothetical protein N0A02_05550 [Paraburkholderia acidicola]|uniref:VCBS repeat protein n=1 Tax=Paraburkholderia acidicola TaxID=1912599 RepID=A0ABV1LHZ4_9BURK